MIQYRKATLEDVALLVSMRMKMLRSVVPANDSEQWALSEASTEKYYSETLESGEHVCILAFDGNTCIGTGGICFYRVLPTYYKPTGEKAYIINMFTDPQYRGRGIGREILRLLVEEALERGVRYITLEATEQGRKLYEKNGFGSVSSEMQFINETYEG